MIRKARRKMREMLSSLTAQGTEKAKSCPGSAPTASFPANMPVSQGRDTTRGKLDSIKSDCRALGAVVKGMRAQVVFSSILLVRTSQ